MPKENDQRALKAEKLLKKVLNRRFTFEASQADLRLLRSLQNGSHINTKPGDPSFHAYVAAINTANEFASQALDIPELIPFNNQLVDLQEEYDPSYPPMSPVTSAFFAGWMVLDARDSFSGLTLGRVFTHYLQHVGQFDYLLKALSAPNDSYCSFYEVTEVGPDGVKLWDIANRQEFPCWNSSGHPGRKGEIWYARLLPPLVHGANRWVTVSTPYVFRDSSRQTWEDFFQRALASQNGAGQSLPEYLKYGKWLGYWLEFVFQAFAGYTGNMILVQGVPDNPASLPYSDPKHKL